MDLIAFGCMSLVFVMFALLVWKRVGCGFKTLVA